jgi:hypothetical protein
MADQVILMKPLHNNNDDAGFFVVQPGNQGVVIPLVYGISPIIDSDKASSGFSGSSKMIAFAPRPVKTPPTQVGIQKLCAVVMNSLTDCSSSELEPMICFEFTQRRPCASHL